MGLDGTTLGRFSPEKLFIFGAKEIFNAPPRKRPADLAVLAHTNCTESCMTNQVKN